MDSSQCTKCSIDGIITRLPGDYKLYKQYFDNTIIIYVGKIVRAEYKEGIICPICKEPSIVHCLMFSKMRNKYIIINLLESWFL